MDAFADTTGTHQVRPTMLQPDSLSHHLAVDVGIAVDHFTLFGAAEIELQVVFFGETDTAMDLVRGGADPAAGIAGPGFSHGDFLRYLLRIGQTPGRPVGDEA